MKIIDLSTNIVAKVLKECEDSRNHRDNLYRKVCEIELNKRGYEFQDIMRFTYMLSLVPTESNIVRQSAYI